MRGSVSIQIQTGLDAGAGGTDAAWDGAGFVETGRIEAATLTFRSAEGEAILSRSYKGELTEVLFLQHATIDIFADDDGPNHNNVEVRGFGRPLGASAPDSAPAAVHHLYRLLFTPAASDV